MLVDITELGTIKLQLEVTWKYEHTPTQHITQQEYSRSTLETPAGVRNITTWRRGDEVESESNDNTEEWV